MTAFQRATQRRRAAEKAEQADRAAAQQISARFAEAGKIRDALRNSLLDGLIDHAANGDTVIQSSAVAELQQLETEHELVRRAFEYLTEVRLPWRRIESLLGQAAECFTEAAELREKVIVERQRVVDAMAKIAGIEAATVEVRGQAEYLRLAARADELQRQGARYEAEARSLEEGLSARLNHR